MSELMWGTAAGALICLAVSPYLAQLTVSAAEKQNDTWWRGTGVGSGRRAVTALVATVLGALAGAAGGWSALLPVLIALALVGTPLVVIDFELHRLPNRLVFTGYALALVGFTLPAAIQHDWDRWLRGVAGGAAVFVVLFAIVFAAPRSFGFGDVKLGGLLGGYLGWFGWLQVYYGIFAGFLLGMVVALVLLASRRASLKSAMAFGPMLIVGALLVLAFDITPSLG